MTIRAVYLDNRQAVELADDAVLVIADEGACEALYRASCTRCMVSIWQAHRCCGKPEHLYKRTTALAASRADMGPAWYVADLWSVYPRRVLVEPWADVLKRLFGASYDTGANERVEMCLREIAALRGHNPSNPSNSLAMPVIDLNANPARPAPVPSQETREETPVSTAPETKTGAGSVIASAAAHTFGRAKEALGNELPQVGWRLAGRKAIERTPPAVLKALVKAKILTPTMSKQVGLFLKTDIGAGLYGLGVGTLLTAHPRAASKPWISALASQMRIEGLVLLGSTIVDPIFDSIEAVFASLLEDVGLDIEHVPPPQIPPRPESDPGIGIDAREHASSDERVRNA